MMGEVFAERDEKGERGVWVSKRRAGVQMTLELTSVLLSSSSSLPFTASSSASNALILSSLPTSIRRRFFCRAISSLSWGGK